MRIPIEIPSNSDVYNLFQSADLLFTRLNKEGYFNEGNAGAAFIANFDVQHFAAIAAPFKKQANLACVTLAPINIGLFLKVTNQISNATISNRVFDKNLINWLPNLNETQRDSFINIAIRVADQLNAKQNMLFQTVVDKEPA